MKDENEPIEDVTLEDEVEESITEEEQTEETVEAESSPPEEQVEHDKAQEAVQRRINKLTAEKYAERRRVEELERQLSEAKANEKPAKKPELEDFEFNETQYNAALIEYQVGQQLANQRRDLEKQQAESVANEKASNFAAKEAEFAAKTPDYMEVVQHMPRLDPKTFDAITSLDNGVEVAYHLANHLDVADEIASAAPHIAAVRLGQIASQLSAKPIKKIETSKAPDPVDTLTPSASLRADDPLIAGATFE
jgi:predicted RNase H-like nuclease (RuvC/YqgF family)